MGGHEQNQWSSNIKCGALDLQEPPILLTVCCEKVQKWPQMYYYI